MSLLQCIKFLHLRDCNKFIFVSFHWPLLQELLTYTANLQVLSLHCLNLDKVFFDVLSGLTQMITLEVGWCMLNLDGVDIVNCCLLIHHLCIFSNKWIHLDSVPAIYSYKLLFVGWCTCLKEVLFNFKFCGEYSIASSSTVIGFLHWPSSL
jgi:hypothetical protein